MKANLPWGWRSTRIGDEFKVRYGKAVPKEHRTPEGAVPVVGSAGTMAYTTTALAQYPCLVVGRKGNIGQAHLQRGPSCPTDTTFYIEAHPDIDLTYVAYLLQSIDFSERNSSTTTPSLRREDLESIPLPLPPLTEQHRIVQALESHLSRLDTAEANARSSELRLASLDRALASRSLGVTYQAGQIPPGWEWSTLDEISRQSSYGTSARCDTRGAGAPVVRIPNIKNGEIDLHDLKFAVAAELDLTKLYLDVGDILFVRTNGSPSLIGRTAVVREPMNAAFASYLIRFRLDSNDLADWVQFVFGTDSWRAVIINAAASSAGQYNLNQTFLKSLRIPIPPEATRTRILRAAGDARTVSSRVRDELQKVRDRSSTLRRSLLRAAFAGELVDQDIADEPIAESLAGFR